MIHDSRFMNKKEEEKKYKKYRKIKSFTDLRVWREGHKLVILVYEITDDFPKKEVYSLINQMRRSSSVTNNIGEGFGRKTYKDKLHFYYQGQGFLIELKDQILIAKDVGYLDENDLKKLVTQANKTHSLLQGFIRKTRSLIHNS